MSEETVETPDTPPEEDAPEEAEPPKKKGRFQERISELVAEREELREERDLWRAELLRRDQEAQRQGAPPEIQVDMSDHPMPRRENFEDEDEFQAALSERAAVKAYRTERARERQQDEIRTQRETQGTLLNWQNQGRAKFENFDVALLHPNQGGPVITDNMAQVLMVHEHGHDIAYYLGTNPQESYRIANLMPFEQGWKSANWQGKAVKPQPRTQSAAPSPTEPVQGREEFVKVPDISDPKLSFKDYERIRLEQMRKRAGGP